MRRLFISLAIATAFLALVFWSASAHAAPEKACRWDDPGHNPYLGSVEDALSDYREIPAANKAELLRKVNERHFDDHVEIRPDGSIRGEYVYRNLRGMHFGVRGHCAGLVKWTWPADRVERALVFTSGRWSLTCPSVCRNCSLSDRGERIPEVSKRAATTTGVVPEGVDFVSGGGSSLRPLDGATLAPVETRDTATGVLVPAWPPNGWGGPIPVVLPPIVGPVNVVPEPATWALFLIGAAALAFTSWRKTWT
jgi:hypothetical protein